MLDYEEIFNDSYERLIRLEGSGDKFFSEFYTQFLAASPKVKEKFMHTNMKKQQKMLKQSLYHMLNFFVYKRASDYIQNIAKIHSKKGIDIEPKYYDLWLDSLVATVQKLDPKYDQDVGLAWKITMSMGITYMKDMYDRDDISI